MSEKARELLEAALQLPTDERALVAAELLASMDGEDQDLVDRAWAREIEERLARAKAGATTFSDCDEVEARVRKRHLDK